jgi:metal-responsive CopG/Arc/MetJ family transcriptional regulator
VSKLSGKSKRVNITLPERVLAVLDAAAKKEGETRSGLLVKAALEYVERHRAA